jgi:hypothetical protein
MSRRRTFAATATVALSLPLIMAAGATAPPDTSAAEDVSNPYSCSSFEIGANGARARCSRSGPGVQFRVEIRCDGFWSDYDRFGPWVTAGTGGVSSIYCDKTADDMLSHRWNVSQPVQQ